MANGDKCDPVVMRKTMEVVEALRLGGVEFVPIPVVSDEHRKDLVRQLEARLDDIRQIIT